MTSVTLTCAGIVKALGEKLRLWATTVSVIGCNAAGAGGGVAGSKSVGAAGRSMADAVGTAVGAAEGSSVAGRVAVAATVRVSTTRGAASTN